MKMMEYQARASFEAYGLPVKPAEVIDRLEQLEQGLAELTYPLVVKAQVQVGGRGKAGGVRFAENLEEVKAICAQLLHSDLKGHRVNKLMIVEKAQGLQELYLSIIMDRLSKKPMIIFSAEGGVDIEEIAAQRPEAIVKMLVDPFVGIQPFMAQYLINKCGLDKGLAPALLDVLVKLYQMFLDKDALLVEINPLMELEGHQLVALDGKVDIDDSALYRQPEVVAYRDEIQEEELILEARRFGFLYIPVEEGGPVAVISNGSGMLMSSIDLISKAGMTVGAVLDLGGGSTAERIKEAVRIVLSNPEIQSLFINIFGGITRCDEVASGLQQALEKEQTGKTIIVRLEGTNKELGLEVIASIPYGVVSVDGLREGVSALAEKGGRA